jgi:hypothetical protein
MRMQFDWKKVAQFFQPPNAAWIWFILTLIAIGIYTMFGPTEYSLGTHMRIVYLHGAWVWASLAAFLTAGVSGGLGLLTRRQTFHCWSGAFGRTGLIFWVTYLPLSLWAMQSNWNGLFLAEPRWKLALVFAITGILLQIGLGLVGKPSLTSVINLGYIISLVVGLLQTTNVLHPTSPILKSDAWRIQLYFFGLVMLTLLAAWQIARWWYKLEPNCF